MVNVIGGAYGPLNFFFLALAVVAFGIEAWAFIDAITRPAQAYLAAGKLTKMKWLFILGIAFVLGLYAAAYGGGIGFLSVIAFVALGDGDKAAALFALLNPRPGSGARPSAAR